MDSLKPIRDYVSAVSTEARLDQNAAYRLALAVDEIATNAILHDFQKRGSDGSLTIHAEITPEELTIVLDDNGEAYDPRRAPLPDEADLAPEQRRVGGFGVHFTLNNVDQFRYERHMDRNRNIFVMWRGPHPKEPAQVPIGPELPSLLLISARKAGDEVSRLYLERLGFHVNEAVDAQQARHVLAREPIELALLDADLDPDGTILVELRATPSLPEVPIAVLVRPDRAEELPHYFDLGAEECFLLPLNPALLRARLQAVMRRRKRQAQERERLSRLQILASTLKEVILPVGIALSVEKDFDRLLERIVLEAKAICHADGGTLYLRTPDDRLKFVIMITTSLNVAMGTRAEREIPFAPLRLYDLMTGAPNRRNIATQVALEGRSVNIPNLYEVEEFDFSATRLFDSQNNYRSISTLTVPLKNNDNEVIGVLQLLNAQEPSTGEVIGFDQNHQLLVELLAAQAAVAVNNQILQRRQADLLRIERDLQIGREIQAGFLPVVLPQPDGWEIAARFDPAREVAGDFYDAFSVARNRVGLVIADVCDKGVGAALFMALTRSLLRAYAQQHYSSDLSSLLSDDKPGEKPDPLAALAGGAGGRRAAKVLPSAGATALKNAVELSNNYIIHTHGHMNMFATLFFGILDPVSGALLYINAGHNPPVIVGAGQVKARLVPTDPAVGMMPDQTFTIHHAQLEPGDLLVAFTDGVTDAKDPAGQRFGEARFLELLTAPSGSVMDVLDRVEAEVRAYIGAGIQFDDIAVLAARRSTR